MEKEGGTKKWLAVATLALLGIVLGMSLQTGDCFEGGCTARPAWWLILPSVGLTGYALNRALAHHRRNSWQRHAPDVQPSDVLTQLLCLRDGFGLSVLSSVPPLVNNTWLAGSLYAGPDDSERLAALIEKCWDAGTLACGTQPPIQSEEWQELQLFKVRLDSEHVVGRWMAEQFAPLQQRVMDQKFTSPKTVPEFLTESTASQAVEGGLERVLVLPLSRDYWDWRPESHLLVVAEATRNATSKYQKILAAVARH